MKRVLCRLETPLDCRYADALRPDDVDLPRGMEIRHLCAGGRWAVEVAYVVEKPEDVLTLKNTLDEVVRALQLIERSIPR